MRSRAGRRAFLLLTGGALTLGFVALGRNSDADAQLPVVRGREGVTAVRLTAITDKDGRSALQFEGRTTPPVLHVDAARLAGDGSETSRHQRRTSS